MHEDVRVGDLIYSTDKHPTEVVLIGFPCDEGVRRNGGRVGARKAPERIRSLFQKLTPHAEHFEDHVRLLSCIHDSGDMDLSGDLDEDQHLLGKKVQSVLSANQIPVILGGGHETSFGHLLAYHFLGSKISVLNWDAHPDVRPLKDGLAHSGSPFRQGLELVTGTVVDYTVAGLQPQHVAHEHLKYLNTRKSAWFWAHDLDRVAIQGIFHGVTRPTMVSVDMDVVNQVYAPGVSSRTAGGLSDLELFEIAYQAGRNQLVRSFDVVEVNPDYDVGDQTARIAAVALWWFTVGLARRPATTQSRP